MAQKKDYARAEKAFIDADKPEMSIRMYLKLQMANEALRVARKYRPDMIADINQRLA